MQGDPNLRSKQSFQNAFVLFLNKTRRIVDVYWVDYEGQFVHYITLKPESHAVINTFSTHPWVFKDKFTGERMHAEHSDVYWPKPFFVVDLLPNVASIRRKQIDIHFPMRSLRENAMWTIAQNLRSAEDIDTLEIPKILKVELTTIFKEYNTHRLRYTNR